MAIVATVAAALQDLLGPVAQRLADTHRLIRRRRKFTAPTLLSTFVLGYLHHPDASAESLAATAATLGVSVTPQAVDQRITAPLRDALRDLWDHAATRLVAADPRATPLLRKFTHVLVGDSTTIHLPDALADTYPGCGGTNAFGRAALKVRVRWDVPHGTLTHAALEAGRQTDATSPAAAAQPPPGALVVQDLGYFALDRFRAWDRAGVRWPSKALPGLAVTADGRTAGLTDWLAGQPGDRVDREVEVGVERVRCRLVAVRVPPAVAEKRRRDARKRAAKKSRRPSARRLAACDWTTYLTNCPAEHLTAAEVEVLYRVRWQVGLLFKLWKSHNRVAGAWSSDPVRQMAGLYARLVGVVVQHWLVLTAGWSDARLSVVKAARRIRERLPQVMAVLTDRPALEAVLTQWAAIIRVRCRLNTRRRQPGTAQLLQQPTLRPTGA